MTKLSNWWSSVFSVMYVMLPWQIWLRYTRDNLYVSIQCYLDISILCGQGMYHDTKMFIKMCIAATLCVLLPWYYIYIMCLVVLSSMLKMAEHDDVIKWKHFPRYSPFVQWIHWSLVNSPHKGQWHGALMLCLICAWINGWVNNLEAGDLSCHHAHYDIVVMDLTLSLTKPSVVLRQTLLSMMILQFVITTTCGATNDYNSCFWIIQMAICITDTTWCWYHIPQWQNQDMHLHHEFSVRR